MVDKMEWISYVWYSPVLTRTWSRRDSITAVARYPCIMIISHWDMLKPVCHKLGASSTIFPSLFQSRPPRSPGPRILPHSRPEFCKISLPTYQVHCFSSSSSRRDNNAPPIPLSSTLGLHQVVYWFQILYKFTRYCMKPL